MGKSDERRVLESIRTKETMNENEKQRYFNGLGGYYAGLDSETLIASFYNFRASHVVQEIPAPLAMRAWEIHETTFWTMYAEEES